MFEDFALLLDLPKRYCPNRVYARYRLQRYKTTWRNLENNVLSSLHWLLRNGLTGMCVGGGGGILQPLPPTIQFRNNSCKDDSALFSRFLHAKMFQRNLPPTIRTMIGHDSVLFSDIFFWKLLLKSLFATEKRIEIFIILTSLSPQNRETLLIYSLQTFLDASHGY